MRAWLMVALLLLPGCMANAPASSPTPSATTSDVSLAKPSDPRFAGFDKAVMDYMIEHRISAASLTVTSQTSTLWTQGFGRLRPDGRQTPNDALFRIASITKPITEAAFVKLAAAGLVLPTDPAFCAGTVPRPRCILTLEPAAGKTADPRLADVTVQNLLEHKGGWDRSVSGDPMFEAINISKAMGVASPPDQTTIARYVIGRPLDFAPGSKQAYSNFGYMLLGLILEKATGQDYTDYVRRTVFAGLQPLDVQQGRTLPDFRDPREPTYACTGLTTSVFDQTRQVCWPDGGWCLEDMEAHGGLIASTAALAWFIRTYWGDGRPRDPSTNLLQYTSLGSLDGTYTAARWRLDGLGFAVFLNQREDAAHPGRDYRDLVDILDRAADDYAKA